MAGKGVFSCSYYAASITVGPSAFTDKTTTEMNKFELVCYTLLKIVLGKQTVTNAYEKIKRHITLDALISC